MWLPTHVVGERRGGSGGVGDDVVASVHRAPLHLLPSDTCTAQTVIEMIEPIPYPSVLLRLKLQNCA